MNELGFFGTIMYDGSETVDIFHNYNRYVDEVTKNFTIREYYIKGSPRPEMLSYQLYGDPHYYWVLLLINKIYDPYYDWVTDDDSVHEYARQKYQYVGGVNKIAYHQNDAGERFWNVVEYPTGSGKWYDINDKDHSHLQYTGSMIPVTRIEAELDDNNKKRVVKIVNPSDIVHFVDSLRSLMEETTNASTN